VNGPSVEATDVVLDPVPDGLTVDDRAGSRSVTRVAIVNRGESAMRFVHAAAELEGVTSIALHTRKERHASFARAADERVCFEDLGIAPTESTPYLDLAVLAEALRVSGADAVWVGWGFVAERPEFAELVEGLGLTFIGPSGAVMRLLGDKIAAKQLASKTGVPVAPWSNGPVGTIEEATAAAARIGFPLMVKAAAGGGGRGIRRVDVAADLPAAFASARSEGAKAFGDDTVFLERVVTGARHVEVQIIADAHGGVWAPGVRDCSVQRRNQKVIEESSSTALTPAHVELLRQSAIRLAQAAGYTNAGTVEFLFQPEEDLLAFLEVNTRLQVEHSVTEVTTGIDLVKLQVAVARGDRLPEHEPPARGHAIEARLNAEDPANDFSPVSGRISRLRLPNGPGVRVDSGVVEGDWIAPEYDSMIAKIIASGTTRQEALARLRRAVRDTTVMIDGGTTNKSFLLGLLDRPELLAGDVDTSWLDGLSQRGEHLSDEHLDVAFVAAAIALHREHEREDLARFLSTALRGRPAADGDGETTVELAHGGGPHRVSVARTSAESYRLRKGGHTLVVHLEQLDEHRSRLQLVGTSHDVWLQRDATSVLLEVDGVAHRFGRDDSGVVRAPSVAVVVGIVVAVGDTVTAGTRLGTIEAMKMETAIVAPVDGLVEEVHVTANTQVEAGTPLLRIVPMDGDGPRSHVAEIALPTAAGAPDDVSAALERVASLRGVVLGFDASASSVAATLANHRAAASRRHPAVRRAELDVLRCFADVCAATRARREPGRDQEVESRSTNEMFHSFLRSFDLDREDLPARFEGRLLDSLRHFDVHTLDRSPQLEAAAHRIFRSTLTRALALRIVTALLEGRLEEAGLDDVDELRETLDRVIASTQAAHPVVGSLARSVRSRHIDEPLLAVARSRTDALNTELLTSVLEGLPPTEHAAAVAGLIGSPLPLMPVVTALDALGSPNNAHVLEILTRRFYDVHHLTHDDVGPGAPGTWTFETSGRTIRIVPVVAAITTVADTVRTAVESIEGCTQDEVVVDVYLRGALEPVPDEELAAALTAQLVTLTLPPAVSQVTVVGTITSAWPEGTPVFTFCPSTSPEGPLAEDLLIRGLHPMVAQRLHLWRLSNFATLRLPAPGQVTLLDCTARENPADRRLVAVAEVRDITPLRDARGKVTAMPEMERVVAECLEGIRAARAADPAWIRHEWNRVLLYVWPEVDMTLDEISAAAKRLVPLTDGLGIEQISLQGRIVDPVTGQVDHVTVRTGYVHGTGFTFAVTPPPTEPMAPLDELTQRVEQCRRRGLTYPYSMLADLVTSDVGVGTFRELDLDPDDDACLVPVAREAGLNLAGIVIGLATTPTQLHPEGIERLVLIGDPTKSMGAIAEPECLRLLAAIDLAWRRGLAIEWYALSAGARISMDSGSENLDWVAAVLRRIVEHTQAGGVIDVVVAGVNVGAQPYWNAEATMLMHTKGILVMTPESAMVLTGKGAIDFSGGVSAEDNLGIGGHERIMGPNGQAQFWTSDLRAAMQLLASHRDRTHIAQGEDRPRRAATTDPIDRDVRPAPHAGGDSPFATVGEIFSLTANPDRKKPFDIRSVMAAVADADHPSVERWADTAEAQGAVVHETRLGGHAVTLLGIESLPLPRTGLVPADGPASWSAGTLFPQSSKKIARAINAASGNRPVVVLANLSGFDGSPESLRRLQLEYGAEIGRAIVNFDGPIVLCVLSRYHGGAFVVFSGRLNDRMEVLAVEGAKASVIGGAPAAAVVFTSEVRRRVAVDPRMIAANARLDGCEAWQRAVRQREVDDVRASVHNEMLTAVAAEFDAIHSVERAVAVGSVDRIVKPRSLRPELIAAVRRGLGQRKPVTR
jgi:acetyl/propionyl-CoA carboxylase alpha subunit/acetyl-CoA carboxylase carboxyltransferase component